ncbi:MAG TPA: hypothetical protein VF950_10590 [Planctomycetota bacterium]
MNALWRILSTVSTILVAVVLAVGIALLMSGAIRADRLTDALSALREGAARPAPAPPEAAVPEESERRQAADALARREEELRRLDVRVAARQAQVEADRQRVAETAARLKADREKFELERQETVQTKTDADLAANVPILSKMDGASIVAVLKGWDDATFVRYLRALKPSKAAEALDAVQNDPKFEPEFRRLPPGAPRGARTRAELLMEEFRKAPQG